MRPVFAFRHGFRLPLALIVGVMCALAGAVTPATASTSVVTPAVAPAVSAPAASAGEATDSDDDGTLDRPDSDSAVVAAKTADEPVEDLSARTETEQTFANPDGSFTAEIATSPVRVKQDGEWSDVDYDLVRGADGVVRPKAASGDVELSGGGSDPVSAISTGSVRTSVTFPVKLPTPSLDGPTATYADVYPDVDLRVTATPAGVSQVLVVQDAKAAANPALDRIHLETDVSGGSIGLAAGGLVVKDAKGQTVGVAATPTMWDSTAPIKGDNGSTISDTAADAVDLRTTAPADGDAIASVPLSKSGDVITLSPESTIAGGAVDYPLYIDPTITASKLKWAMVSSAYKTTAFYKWPNTDNLGYYGQGVGYQNYNATTTVKRLYWNFDTSKLSGATVSSATFTARVVAGASCDKPYIGLYRTNTISSSTTWNNQPSWGNVSTPAYKTTDDRFISEARPDSCTSGGSQTQRDVEWDFKRGMQTAAANKYANLTVGLRSRSETDPTDWKRFTNGAVARVTYSKPPSKPTDLKVNGKPCSDSPVRLGTLSVAPQLEAKLSDPDSGESLTGTFTYNSTPTQTPVPPALTTATQASGNVHKTLSANFVVQPDPVTHVMPDGSWSFSVKGKDSSVSHLTGPSSDACTFTIDSTQPATASATIDGDWTVGQSKAVSFAPGDPNDTSAYQWTLNNATPDANQKITPVNSDKTITAPLPSTGVRVGVNVLRVWAVDAAGNRSADPVEIAFEGAGIDPPRTSTYTFNGKTGANVFGDSTAADSGADPDTANPTPKNMTGVASHWLKRGEAPLFGGTRLIDNMLQFTSTTGAAPYASGDIIETSNGAADSSGLVPNQSFKLSAWLNPTESSSNVQTALSYGTDNQPSIELGIEPNPDDGNVPYYYLSLWDQAHPSAPPMKVRSSQPVIFDDEDHTRGFTHVVGWYSATSNELVLVTAGSQDDADPDDGIDDTKEYEQNSIRLPSGFQLPESTSSNRLTVGATHAAGADSNPWRGWIDHIVVEQGAGSASAVDHLHDDNIRDWSCEYDEVCS